VNALRDIANNLFNSNQYKKALDIYLQILDEQPNDYEAIIKIGYCYSNLNLLYNADKYANKAIEISPDSAEGYYLLSSLSNKKGLVAESFHYAEKAHLHSPESFILLVNYANACMNLGDYKKSVDLLQKAINIKPLDYNARQLLYISYMRQGCWSAAFAQAEMMHSINPSLSTIWNLIFSKCRISPRFSFVSNVINIFIFVALFFLPLISLTTRSPLIIAITTLFFGGPLFYGFMIRKSRKEDGVKIIVGTISLMIFIVISSTIFMNKTIYSLYFLTMIAFIIFFLVKKKSIFL